MGQLEAYSLQDIYLISIISGVLATYFAEEIEATVESVAPYAYSTNFISKKRCKIAVPKVYTGEAMGAMHTTFNFFQLTGAEFMPIDTPIADKTIWQDQFLKKWQKSRSSNSSTVTTVNKTLTNA